MPEINLAGKKIARILIFNHNSSKNNFSVTNVASLLFSIQNVILFGNTRISAMNETKDNLQLDTIPAKEPKKAPVWIYAATAVMTVATFFINLKTQTLRNEAAQTRDEIKQMHLELEAKKQEVAKATLEIDQSAVDTLNELTSDIPQNKENLRKNADARANVFQRFTMAAVWQSLKFPGSDQQTKATVASQISSAGEQVFSLNETPDGLRAKAMTALKVIVKNHPDAGWSETFKKQLENMQPSSVITRDMDQVSLVTLKQLENTRARS